jgi:hypothetical protein
MTGWSAEIIRARFTEAADTLRRLPGGMGGGGAAGFWPGYVYSEEDMAGWGAARIEEEREMIRRRSNTASPAAISRFNEVELWTSDLIRDERRRRIVWQWATCRMYGSSFRARCKKEGWVPVTAYRRLISTIDRILFDLDNNGVALRLPESKWLLQEEAKSPSNSPTLGIGDTDEKAPTAQRSPTSFIMPGAKAVDTLTTPAAVADFTKFLRRTNTGRRREQERDAS